VTVRLGVLDVGSNTVHLLVVDARSGGHPTPMTSEKAELRLAEQLDPNGCLTDAGMNALVQAVERAAAAATTAECIDMLAFATSALRDAANCDDVVDRVRAETGVVLRLLPGEDEARYTFLAARRWYGWSAGRLLIVDIGGGSLELAAGRDEDPDVAASLPLGAGRLTRDWFTSDPPSSQETAALADWIDSLLTPVADRVQRAGDADLVVGTSKTLRSLARLTGAAPSGAGLYVRRVLTQDGLRQILGFISRLASSDLAELEGVSARRANQLLGGALVASAVMRALGLPHLEICPWALREGVILRRLDMLTGTVDLAVAEAIDDVHLLSAVGDDGSRRPDS
jgi:exopolyphosphatase/guanosine-5'-triphosphate,3'-diphosphate pyrophosphatase